ncbi:hypothetical protein Y046_3812 [Burkholderia pseudomallei MSHR2990]|nr:hypothetical protein Y046_3812 [Burkholderia pseudomallei MSHR2990]
MQRHELARIKRLLRFDGARRARTLVELNLHVAAHVLLRFVDERLQAEPLVAEPQAAVDDVAVVVRHEVAQALDVAAERDLLELAMRGVQDRQRGVLEHAAHLQAVDAVLDDVLEADAVAGARFVEPLDQLDRPERRAVDADGHAPAEPERDRLDRIRRLRGRRDPVRVAPVERVRDALQIVALRRDVHEILVVAQQIVRTAFDRNAVLLTIREQILARLQRPDAPRRDRRQIGREDLRGHLEAHLIVALLRAAVRQAIDVVLARVLDEPLDDRRAGERRAEQIVPLVRRVRLQRGKHEIADERLAQILDDELVRAGDRRAAFHPLPILLLPEVRAIGGDAAIEMPLQEVQRGGRVEAAGISEENVFGFHVRSSVMDGFAASPTSRRGSCRACRESG